MDQDLLVDEQIEAGKALIAELIRSRFDVGGACWARRSDSRLWSLYIVSSSYPSTPPTDDFRTLHLAMNTVGSPAITPSQVRLVGQYHAIAYGLNEIGDRFSAGTTTRFGGVGFEKAGMDEVYIYPSLVNPISPGGVLRVILDLSTRRGVVKPSLVIMRDGTGMEAVPVGFKWDMNEGLTVKLRDPGTSMDRSVQASDIASIL